MPDEELEDANSATDQSRYLSHAKPQNAWNPCHSIRYSSNLPVRFRHEWRSRLCEEIDERVRAFLERPIEGDRPYLRIDATYVNARPNGLVSLAAIIAVGVNADGRREVLGKQKLATSPANLTLGMIDWACAAASFREDSLQVRESNCLRVGRLLFAYNSRMNVKGRLAR